MRRLKVTGIKLKMYELIVWALLELIKYMQKYQNDALNMYLPFVSNYNVC